MRAVGLVLALLVAGCSAKLGPGEFGWVGGGICTNEGGVEFDATIMGTSQIRFGCTDPPPEEGSATDHSHTVTLE